LGVYTGCRLVREQVGAVDYRYYIEIRQESVRVLGYRPHRIEKRMVVRGPIGNKALPRNLWVVFALLSGATVAFSQAWLGRSMAGRKKVALAM
jgi:hypothetical protein